MRIRCVKFLGRWARVGFFTLSGLLLLLSRVLASHQGGDDQIQIAEIMAGANGDSSIQFVELRFTMDGNDWTNRAKLVFYDSVDTIVGEYVFSSNPENTSGGAKSVLVGTQAFADLELVNTTDFIIPASMVATAGKVCFEGHGTVNPFATKVCVAYGDSSFDEETGKLEFVGTTGTWCAPIASLPITNAKALQRVRNTDCFWENCYTHGNYVLQVATPKNSHGETGSFTVLSDALQGENLFRKETFLGNGRTCFTCHRDSDGFGLNPSTIEILSTSMDPLFVAEQATYPSLGIDSSLVELEHTCKMTSGRALILENVEGFAKRPVFRTSPHLMNVGATGPWGWSPDQGGADDLGDFAQGAIKQHFPKFLLPTGTHRRFDPNAGAITQRLATQEEQNFMEAFMESIKTVVSDPTGDLGTDGDDRESNLDRLIEAFIDCENLSQTAIDAINDGREFFFNNPHGTRDCAFCHAGPFLGNGFDKRTGVVDMLVNPDGDISTDALENDDVCGEALTVDEIPGEFPDFPFVRPFNIRPLVDIARVRDNFFHAGEANAVNTNGDQDPAAALRRSVEFYTTDAFAQSPFGDENSDFASMTEDEIDDVVAFLQALVATPNCEGACCDGASCTIETREDCLSAGDIFLGQDGSCSVSRACCVDSSCTTETECECEALGGTWSPGLLCFHGGGCP